MLKLTLAIAGDSLSVEGDLGFLQVLPLIHDWLAALPRPIPTEFTARVTQDLGLLLTHQGVLMTTVADLQAQATKALAAIAAESDKDDAIIALVKADTGMLTSLKQQLADAIAGGNDPAALDAVLASMTAAETSALTNAAKVTDAVNANTTPAA